MNNEVTVQELKILPEKSYMLIDIRDEYAFSYGHIDNAVNIPQKILNKNHTELPRDKKLIICCKSGIISHETAEMLCENGYDAYNLKGGYAEWLRTELENRNITENVEKSIRKKFHKNIWSKFAKAITVYQLVNPGDKIAVCISGGKDAKQLQVPFELIKYVHENGKLPVVNFAAGGIATPADAALMMQLGSEGVFVDSGIFKSGDPEKRANAIVKAVTNYDDPDILAKLSENLGEAMVGINEHEIALLMSERGK